jgi:GNAT superfamily N-acetyltransferase
MKITAATASDVEEAVRCLAAAFAKDPITGFLLQFGPNYRERVTQFFSLLMRARIELKMPVLVARTDAGIHGAAMGYSTEHPPWSADLTEAWNRFEGGIPGMADRLAVYEGIAAKHKPTVPHYYLGVIGVDPGKHGQGIGKQLIEAFCALSAADQRSGGVYLETANPSNVPFYKSAGFTESGRGTLENDTLWCMFSEHSRQ